MELQPSTQTFMRPPKANIRERLLSAVVQVYDGSGGLTGLNGRQIAAWAGEIPATTHRYLKAMQSEGLIDNFQGDWWRPTAEGRAFLLNCIALRRIAS